MKSNFGALILFAAAVAAAPSAEMTADEIMARVAENQDRSLEARKNWTYRQTILTRLNRTNGKLAREEDKEYTVIPTPQGFDKKLARFSGKYEDKGKFIEYDNRPGHENHRNAGIDGEFAGELADELMSDKAAKDGLAPGLFPLSRKEQTKYSVELRGRERYRDHEVYKIEFKPKREGFNDDDGIWAGEALIDTAELQPVLITSFQAKAVPV